MPFLKIALIVIAAVAAAVPLPRRTVEHVFSRMMYPAIQPRLTSLSNSVPFAFFDAVLLLAVAALVTVWTIRIRTARRPASGPRPWRRRGRLALGAAFDAAAIAAVLYVWFLATWGLNYQRQRLGERLDFREERITHDALVALAGRTVDSLNRLHAAAHADGWPAAARVSASLEPAFAAVQRDLALGWMVAPARPKRTLLNFYLARVSIDGMTDPFFLETLTNDTLLPFEVPATVAHEWGHLAGYAHESEASFVGWLVCLRGTPAIQYSGWLSLYGTVAGALPRHEREAIAGRLEPGPRQDLRAIGDRIRRYAIPIASRAGYAAYDRFLKANRVESGVNSYGEVIRLVLGTRFTEHGAPVLVTEPGIN